MSDSRKPRNHYTVVTWYEDGVAEEYAPGHDIADAWGNYTSARRGERVPRWAVKHPDVWAGTVRWRLDGESGTRPVAVVPQ